jgi:hypothetical protein
MPSGIGHMNMDGFAALRRDFVILPIAALNTYVVNAASVTSAVAGDALTRTTPGQRPLVYARRLNVIKTDASGSTLQVVLRIRGKRFGRDIEEIVSCVAAGTETVNGTRVYDEVTSVTILSITGAAASDTVSVGVDANWLGLQAPLRSKADFLGIHKIANGTPDATNGVIPKSVVTAAQIDTRDSAINVQSIYSAVIAVTDRYVIDYFAKGQNPTNIARSGVKFG